MVCPYCTQNTGVINSRHQKRANQVWRRRKCSNCGAVFTTTESIDLSGALRVRKTTGLEPFLRDTLLLSLYESLKHRKSALQDATALTGTVISALHPLADATIVDRDVITTVTISILERFDKAAATHYQAFHP